MSARTTVEFVDLPLATSGLRVGVGPKVGPRTRGDVAPLELPLASAGLTGVGLPKDRREASVVADLPLATHGLAVGASVKMEPPADGAALKLPLATQGLAVGALVKAGPATDGAGLTLPLTTSGLSVGVGITKKH
jgi:hypothetical protein